MANVDTSIYGQIKQFKIDTPSEREAKRLALDNARLQSEAARRQFTLEDDISSALSESGGDYTRASQSLAQRGRGAAAIQLRDKADAQSKSQLEQRLKIMEAVGSDGIALDSAFRQALDKHRGNEQLALQEVQPIYSQVRAKWQQMGHQLPERFDPVANMAGIGQAKEVAAYLSKLLPQKETTPSSIREYEYAVKQGFKGTLQDFITQQKKAGATNVTQNAGTEKKYGEAFAGKVADADVSMRDVALKAPELAERANSVIGLLNSGNITTGTGADIRLAIGKALNLAGGSDQETIANTEALVSELASTTLDAIKGSGLGSGQGFTDKDRAFLEKAKAGQISLEASTIRRIAVLNHRAAEKSAERWNKRVKEIPESALQGTGISRDPITIPPINAQAAKPKTDARTVVVNGKTYNFPTPAAAKRFKEEAGIKDD